MKTNKIIVTIRGGTVESVHVNSQTLPVEVVILDYDNLSHGDAFTDEQLVAEGEIEYKQVIEVL